MSLNLTKLVELLEAYYGVQSGPEEKGNINQQLINYQKSLNWEDVIQILEGNENKYVLFFALNSLNGLVDKGWLDLSEVAQSQVIALLQSRWISAVKTANLLLNKIAALLVKAAKIHWPIACPTVHAMTAKAVHQSDGAVALAGLQLLQILYEDLGSHNKFSSSYEHKQLTSLIVNSLQDTTNLLETAIRKAFAQEYTGVDATNLDSAIPIGCHSILRAVFDICTAFIPALPPQTIVPPRIHEVLLTVMTRTGTTSCNQNEDALELATVCMRCLTGVCTRRGLQADATKQLLVTVVEVAIYVQSRFNSVEGIIESKVEEELFCETVTFFSMSLQNHFSRLVLLEMSHIEKILSFFFRATTLTAQIPTDDSEEISEAYSLCLETWMILLEFSSDASESTDRAVLQVNRLIFAALEQLASVALDQMLMSRKRQNALGNGTQNGSIGFEAASKAVIASRLILSGVPGANALSIRQPSMRSQSTRLDSQQSLTAWREDAELDLIEGLTLERDYEANTSVTRSWGGLPMFSSHSGKALLRSLELLSRLSRQPQVASNILATCVPSLNSSAEDVMRAIEASFNSDSSLTSDAQGRFEDFASLVLLCSDTLLTALSEDLDSHIQVAITTLRTASVVLRNCVQKQMYTKGAIWVHVCAASALACGSLVNVASFVLEAANPNAQDTECGIKDELVKFFSSILSTCIDLLFGDETRQIIVPEIVSSSALRIFGAVAVMSSRTKSLVVSTPEFRSFVSILCSASCLSKENENLLVASCSKLLLAIGNGDNRGINIFESMLRRKLDVFNEMQNFSDVGDVVAFLQQQCNITRIKEGLMIMMCCNRALQNDSSSIVKPLVALLESIQYIAARWTSILLTQSLVGSFSAGGAVLPVNLINLCSCFLQEMHIFFESFQAYIKPSMSVQVVQWISEAIASSLSAGSLRLVDETGQHASPAGAKLLLYFIRVLKSSTNVRVNLEDAQRMVSSIVQTAVHHIGRVIESNDTNPPDSNVLSDLSPPFFMLLRTIMISCWSAFVTGKPTAGKHWQWRNNTMAECFSAIFRFQIQSFSNIATDADLAKLHLVTWRRLDTEKSFFSSPLFANATAEILSGCCHLLLHQNQIIIEEDIIATAFSIVSSSQSVEEFFCVDNTACRSRLSLASALQLQNIPSSDLKQLQQSIEISSRNDIQTFERSLRHVMTELRRLPMPFATSNVQRI